MQIPFKNSVIWGFALLVLAVLTLYFSKSTSGLAAVDTTKEIDYAILEDTFIASGFPNTQQGNTTGLWLGRDIQGGFQEEIVFLKFSAPTLGDNQTVLAAQIEMTVAWSTGDGNAVGTEILLISGDWNEDLTWHEYVTQLESGQIIELARASGPAISTIQSGPTLFDATTLVQEWLTSDQPVGTIGFLMRASSLPDGQVERGFWSKECGTDCSPPRLIVTYATLDASVTLEAQPSIQPAFLDDIPFNLTITNTGEADLRNVSALVTKPVNTEWSLGSSEVFTWTIGTLPLNESAQIQYLVRPLLSPEGNGGTIEHSPVTVEADDVTRPFSSNPKEIPYVNLGLETSLFAHPSVVTTGMQTITYSIVLENLSDVDLNNVKVRANRPTGTQWPLGEGGTIPYVTPVPDSDEITWNSGISVTKASSTTLQYQVQFTAPQSPTIPAIVHTPVNVTVIYQPDETAPQSQTYPFFTNYAVIPVKDEDNISHVYMPIGAKDKTWVDIRPDSE